jgi:hypothetical protein
MQMQPRINIVSLIEARQYISAAYIPTLKLYRGSPEKDHATATLSWLSSREDYWDLFACLLGFSEQENRSLGNILQDVPFEGLLSGQKSMHDVSFLTYCRNWSSLPDEDLIASAYTIGLVAQPDDLNMAGEMAATCTQWCAEFYLNKTPKDVAGFNKCVDSCP